MLDLAGAAADLAEFAFLTGETVAIAQLGIDLKQLQAQVAAMRLVIDGVLQQLGSLAEATVGDIDVGLADHIASLGGNALLGYALGRFRSRGYRGFQLGGIEGSEAVVPEVQVAVEAVLFIAGGQAVLQLALLQRVAAGYHHQQNQQSHQRAAAGQHEQHRVGQHVVDDAGLRRFGNRGGRR
ncbi:hypothetical protein D3C85_1159290 [compost metagenome]